MADSFLQVKNIGAGFPCRRIIVELTHSLSGQSLFLNFDNNDIDVKVSLNRNYGGIDPKATISLCNLSQDTIKTFSTPFFAPQNPNKITVYAGYETIDEQTSKIPLLFTGDILWAIPTSGRPDIWFTITAVENFFKINDIVSWTQEQSKGYATRIELVEGICKSVGFENIDLTWFDRLNTICENQNQAKRMRQYLVYPFDFEFQGSFGSFLKEIYSFGRMTSIIMGNKITILPCSDDITFMKQNKSLNALEDVYIVSSQTNPPMIGNPNPNPTGVNLTMLFNQDIVPMSFISLQSKIYTEFNMEYWVQQVRYDLHLRGQNFYSHIIARR